MFDIRDLEPADGSRARAITAEATEDLRRVYRPKSTSTSAPTARTSSVEPSGVLVAKWEGELLGLVEYVVTADAVLVRGLAVARSYRMCGVARALIDQVERIARQHSKRALELVTIKETGNPALFERLGFMILSDTPSERFEASGGQAVSEVRMQRPIPARAPAR